MSAPATVHLKNSKASTMDLKNATPTIHNAVHYIELFYHLSKSAEKEGHVERAKGFSLVRQTIWKHAPGKPPQVFLKIAEDYLTKTLALELSNRVDYGYGFVGALEKSLRIIRADLEALKTVSIR